MNAIVTLDSILEPPAGTPALTAADLFGTGNVAQIVDAIEAQVRAEAFDVTTEAGRKHVKSVAYKVARSKTILDEIGKEHVAEIKKQSAGIDAERKALRDRLDALKGEISRPVDEWEEAEANRISGHENALVAIVEAGRGEGQGIYRTPADIGAAIEHVRKLCRRDWQEFHERAEAAASEALPKLEAAMKAAEQAAAERAELEALRAEKAERDARDAAERQRAAQEQAEAEQKASAEEQERQRAAQLAAWKAEQEAKAKQEAEDAAARAIEQERARVAAEQAEREAAERKRQDSKRNRDRVHAKIRGVLLSYMGDDDANRLIAEIAAGDVPHLSITY
ncbi:hypothetical protein VRZ08_00945 [Rhodopseudomonas sp. G2_2311]|uniref:hypothetical protein n=1 Tax=Rhodopseudomonas sp. G2_2311 TaxID=3114287 RepID=UPI0039C6E48B